ncbi:hypothetical protein N656DRAFT_799417 [Canariomyces notabilis]|uniref:Uncharacterized protein n=1 Tax=Canariomyces notabilis TaxID=2074819 RepID=A0AAN6TB58_9PEZI|nr:hypothetical protein N656DRAFT_799417 [Canariomyces arenarius]
MDTILFEEVGNQDQDQSQVQEQAMEWHSNGGMDVTVESANRYLKSFLVTGNSTVKQVVHQAFNMVTAMKVNIEEERQEQKNLLRRECIGKTWLAEAATAFGNVLEVPLPFDVETDTEPLTVIITLTDSDYDHEEGGSKPSSRVGWVATQLPRADLVYNPAITESQNLFDTLPLNPDDEFSTPSNHLVRLAGA